MSIEVKETKDWSLIETLIREKVQSMLTDELDAIIEKIEATEYEGDSNLMAINVMLSACATFDAHVRKQLKGVTQFSVPKAEQEGLKS